MAEIHAHQSSRCSEDSEEEEARIIAKNKLDISVYKFYRHPLNYRACANLRASGKENVLTNTNPPYGSLPSTWVFSRPTGNTASQSTSCAYWLRHLD